VPTRVVAEWFSKYGGPVRRLSDSAYIHGAAVAVLFAAAWVVVAGRLSVWFHLEANGFGGSGFVAPTGTSATVLDAACVAVGVLAIATAARPGRPLGIVLAIAALVLSVGGLAEWWSEATVDADYPAGTLRETSVSVLVSPSTAGWFVLASLAALQCASLALLPRRQPILIAMGALVVGTVAIGLLAPDHLSGADDQVTMIR
jgi:subtilisin family serine protease